MRRQSQGERRDHLIIVLYGRMLRAWSEVAANDLRGGVCSYVSALPPVAEIEREREGERNLILCVLCGRVGLVKCTNK